MAEFHYCRRRWPADAAHLGTARRQLLLCLHDGGVRAGLAADVVLAAGEALDNAATHAYRLPPETRTAPGAEPGLVELTVLIDPDEVAVIVRDSGRWHDPDVGELEHDSPTHRARHGRGITLMNALVEDVAIHHGGHGTSVLLRTARKTRPRRGPTPSAAGATR